MERHQTLRLYNGFLEGEPRLAADLYGATLVQHNYADPPPKSEPLTSLYIGYLPKVCVHVRTIVDSTADVIFFPS